MADYDPLNSYAEELTSLAFLDELGLTDKAILYKGGDPERSVPFTCIWDEAAEAGENQVLGDGTVIHNQPAGDIIRISVNIEAPKDLDVDQLRDPPDKIENVETGQIVVFKRVISSDPFMKTLRCVEVEAARARRRHQSR